MPWPRHGLCGFHVTQNTQKKDMMLYFSDCIKAFALNLFFVCPLFGWASTAHLTSFFFLFAFSLRYAHPIMTTGDEGKGRTP